MIRAATRYLLRWWSRWALRIGETHQRSSALSSNSPSVLQWCLFIGVSAVSSFGVWVMPLLRCHSGVSLPVSSFGVTTMSLLMSSSRCLSFWCTSSSFRGVSPVAPHQWISFDEAEAVAVGMWRQVVEVCLSSLSYTWGRSVLLGWP